MFKRELSYLLLANIALGIAWLPLVLEKIQYTIYQFAELTLPYTLLCLFALALLWTDVKYNYLFSFITAIILLLFSFYNIFTIGISNCCSDTASPLSLAGIMLNIIFFAFAWVAYKNS